MAFCLSNQEDIIELVKAGDCQTVLKRLDKQQIKKFPSYYISRLMFELIPQNTRSAKQLAELVLENGTLSWEEKNDDGNRIHTVMIWHGTVDLAFRAVKALNRRNAHDRKLSSVWTELLLWFLV